MSDAHRFARNALRRITSARRFPENTDPYSRHVELIGWHLAHGKPYPMLLEEAAHCAGSMLVTVENLYKARNEIEQLRAKLKAISPTPDELPPQAPSPR